MDFFEHQERARRRTGRLVLYFGVAVLLIAAMLYVVAMLIVNWSMQSESSSSGPMPEYMFWSWEVLIGIILLCVLIIGGGSLYRIVQLAGGGSVVAESLGGKLIDYSAADPDERRLLNVIEEMAIASGVPVPPVYLIEDSTINAFAAGYKPTDAVIGVTRGCVEHLDRDQLQGVMAHEFSHIFNGDMRLNIRLIGVIHGLLVMGIIGWFLFRFIGPVSGGRRSGGGKGNGGGAMLAIMLFGFAMMAVGFIGTFFGRLIQSAVSRQREFLADASAVQFTRNPEGIAGALRAIGGLKERTKMPHTASEYNHMFFSQALDSVFATHPPLKLRISRIEQTELEEDGEAPAARAVAQAATAGVSGFASEVATADVHNAIESIGQVNSNSIAAVGRVLTSLPDDIQAAAHDTWGARLVVLALLLPASGNEKSQHLKVIDLDLDDQHMKMLRDMHASVRNLHPAQRLPLLDMCIPALSRLSQPQYEAFMDLVSRVIRSDGNVSLFEWCLHTTLQKHLGERFEPASKHQPRTRRIASRMDDAVRVLATVSYLGADDPVVAMKAWKSGMAILGVSAKMPPIQDCTLRELRGSLEKLSIIKFQDRRRLLEACEACIDHDGRTSIEEAELMRAIADTIDCPMPRIVPDAA